MTREEAIETLRNAAWLGSNDNREKTERAVEMAIIALQAQDVDAISRQAVMWMLTNLSYNLCKTQGEDDLIDTAKTLVMTMPSAQPELIEKAAYIRGFEQGRTQGMIDSQGRKK